ncbi:MAG TPA: methyltransferase [Bacteroidota bacterium]|nr:methyltransferase [Bacteroidota bacterium]
MRIFLRFILGLYRRFILKRRIEKTDEVKLFGFSFLVPPTVFHPALYFTSKYFAEYLMSLDFTGMRVLDIGCGSGVLSVIAASRGGKVTAVDINPKAAAITKENAFRNALGGSIETHEGDIFSAFNDTTLKFDRIIMNPPFLDGAAKDDSEKAWRGGENQNFMTRFCEGAAHYLAPGGKIILVLSSIADIESILMKFKANRFAVNELQSKPHLVERLSIYEAVKA